MTMLALLVTVLFVVAALGSFAGWIWLVVHGFRTSVGWGFAMFFVAPVAAIVAAVRDWTEWKKPFLLYFGGAGVQVVLLVIALVALPFALPFGGAAETDSLEGQPFVRSLDAPPDAPAAEGAAPAPEGEAVGFETAAEGAPVAAVAEPAELPTDAPRPRTPMEVIPDPDDAERIAAAPSDPTGQPASASMTDHVAGNQSAAPMLPPSTEVPIGFEETTFAAASTKIGSKVRVITTDGKVHPGTLSGFDNGALRVTFDVGGGSVTMDFSAAEVRALQVAR